MPRGAENNKHKPSSKVQIFCHKQRLDLTDYGTGNVGTDSASTARDPGARIPGRVFNVLYTGKYKHWSGTEFEVSKESLEEIVANFNNKTVGVELAINYNHKVFDKASGWIVGMSITPGENGNYGLDHDVEWTPAAAQSIADGEYRYYSSELYLEYVHHETGKKSKNVISGGGLTNVPFFQKAIVECEQRGGDQIFCHQGHSFEKEDSKMDLKDIKAALFTNHEINLDDLQKRALRLEAVESELEKAKEDLGDAEEKARLAEAAAKEAEDKLKESEEKSESEAVEAVLNSLMREGKATRFHCDNIYRQSFKAMGSEKAKKLAKEMPVVLHVQSVGAQGGFGDGEGEGETEDEKRHAAAKNLQAKEGISFQEALRRTDLVMFEGGKR